jgi:hypothetical protein
MCTHSVTPPHTHLHTNRANPQVVMFRVMLRARSHQRPSLACPPLCHGSAPGSLSSVCIVVPPIRSTAVWTHALHILTLIVTGVRSLSLSSLCMPACRCVGSSSSSRTRFSPQFHRSSSSPGRGTFPPVDHPSPPSTHPRAGLRCCRGAATSYQWPSVCGFTSHKSRIDDRRSPDSMGALRNGPGRRVVVDVHTRVYRIRATGTAR